MTCVCSLIGKFLRRSNANLIGFSKNTLKSTCFQCFFRPMFETINSDTPKWPLHENIRYGQTLDEVTQPWTLTMIYDKPLGKYSINIENVEKH